MIRDKQHHLNEVRAFLQRHFADRSWFLSVPQGSGQETYYAQNSDQALFIKLNVDIDRIIAMASLRITPQVLQAGALEDGTSIVVQPFITGRNPSWSDFHAHLERFADIIRTMQQSAEVAQALPEAAFTDYRSVGIEAWSHLVRKWDHYRRLVPGGSHRVDAGLAEIKVRLEGFDGNGLVPVHHDICNANWLITPDERLYLVDLELMALDDPAMDLGAILWWYYPPRLRQRFLNITGHLHDPSFENRMRTRMAMHCLNILLPRESSFDQFDCDGFTKSLVDFNAALAGEENPRGYDDENRMRERLHPR